MALTRPTYAVDNISSLSEEPNVIEGLTGPQLQARYDKVGADGKTYLTDTLLPELDTNISNINAGYIKLENIFAFSTADTPTFVATTSIDCTGFLSVGMKIKLTQTTVKYFIITAITNTTVTLYGGTDYTLLNAPITNIYYSDRKAPYGFPLDPAKWTVTVTAAGGSQANPVQNQWYYTPYGSVNISLPIGSWEVSYQLTQGCNRSASSDLDNVTALSLSSTTQSGGISTRIYTIGLNTTLNQYAMIPLTVTVKTPLYIIAKTQMTTVVGLAVQGITLRAVCRYV